MCLAIAQEPASIRAGHRSRCRSLGVELEPSAAMAAFRHGGTQVAPLSSVAAAATIATTSASTLLAHTYAPLSRGFEHVTFDSEFVRATQLAPW